MFDIFPNLETDEWHGKTQAKSLAIGTIAGDVPPRERRVVRRANMTTRLLDTALRGRV
jgi:hypothetical protein